MLPSAALRASVLAPSLTSPVPVTVRVFTPLEAERSSVPLLRTPLVLASAPSATTSSVAPLPMIV